MIPADVRDNRSTQRKIVLDEIESLIVFHYPGQAAVDKKKKLELLRTHFEASWTEIESVMPLERLRQGYDTLHFTLEEAHSRYHQEQLAEQMNDELPGDLAPPKQLDHTLIDGTPAFLRRPRTVVPAPAEPATEKLPARIQRNLDRLKVRAPELAPKPEPVPYWEAALAAE